ncbi:MAG: LPS assembly protein LptD [Pseudomonadota bacterium]|nr:LPS assembly protein LptD [Pseudomonadota bacterium]MDO7710684.1 LPS assembly protein LptD [Pseudomonadota bacterium]
MRKLIILSTVTLTCFSSLVLSEVSWPLCDISNDADFLPYFEGSEETAVDVKADDARLTEGGVSVFTGNVIVNRAGQELTASRATYDQNTGDVTAQGDVNLRDSEMIVKSQQAEWSTSKDEGTLDNAQYRIREMHARGEASHVYRQGKVETELTGATYTTCAPGDDAWLLQASKVNLDHEEAVGSARNVVIRLGGIPVFYTPYLSFPLNDERKSGFLIPSLGTSDKTGFDVSTPYYWNISPNTDATVTPRYMADRGLMLMGEFRYLDELGQGVIDAGFLSSDDLENDGAKVNPNYQEVRKHFSWQNASQLSSRWNSTLDYNYVSDSSYLEDFGTSLSLASTTHLNRELNVRYNADNWNFTGRLKGYQTLTDDVTPYKQLPQLRFNGLLPDHAMGLSYGMTAEYVDFDHDEKTAGQRFDIEPSVSLPWRNAAGFITPRLALRHTQYNLTENGTTVANKTPSRTLPVASLDSGLFFDREMTFAGSSYTHTLEPRVFYLYIPERDQAEIPVFDSGLRTFNMGQMFAYDRFTGADRVGDANQVTTGLTSRIIEQQSGRELLRVSLGQIHYFQDRKVSIANNSVATRSDSDMVAEIVASIAKEWTARGEIQWNPNGSTNNMSALSLRYRGDNGQLLNVSHRYRRDAVNTSDGLEQLDISARIPFNQQWSMVGRWYHSLQDNRTLEGLAGIEYGSCCWATRLVLRDYVNSATDLDRNLAIFFQIELKGLGNFGQNSDSLLEESVLGFGS